MVDHPTSVRLDDDLSSRLDRIAEALTRRAAGVSVGRSRALKLAIERGIDALEEELGLRKKKR